MKTRRGYVSNSSSSSFIIGFKEKPKSVEEVQELFFGKRENVPNECYYEKGNGDCAEPTFDTRELSETIFINIQTAVPMTEAEVIEEINSGWFEGHPEYDYDGYDELHAYDYEREYKKRTGHDVRENRESKEYKEWNDIFDKAGEKRNKEWREAAKEYWKQNKQLFKGKKCYVLSYSDNDGAYYATLEHGGILDGSDKVPCIRISHH